MKYITVDASRNKDRVEWNATTKIHENTPSFNGVKIHHHLMV